MTQQPVERESGDPLLARIWKGMQVVDQHGANIGVVERVYRGLPLAIQGATDTMHVKAIEQELFGSDQLPEMLRTRLLEQGFLRVDRPGLRAEDCYLMPEQIDRIESGRVYLRIPLDRTISHSTRDP